MANDASTQDQSKPQDSGKAFGPAGEHAEGQASASSGNPVGAFAKQVGDAFQAAGKATADAAREASARAQAKAKAGARSAAAQVATFRVEDVISAALKVPGVAVDRKRFLAKAIAPYGTEAQRRNAANTSPIQAGYEPEIVDKLAQDAINAETVQATGGSVIAGIPSGPVAMAPATLADLAQFYAHLLRVAQKLGYLYGWGDIIQLRTDESSDIDPATRDVLVLFLGVMCGVNDAEQLLLTMLPNVSPFVRDQLTRSADAASAVSPAVKQVLQMMDVQMAKRLAGTVAGKAVPVVGGVVSGALTYISFGPMASRLAQYLKDNPLTPDPDNPGVPLEVEILEVLDVEEQNGEA